MTTEAIVALQAGHELDRAVHLTVFGSEAGKIPAYSTKVSAAMKLLDRLPLFVGSLAPDHAKFDPTRPFVAGVLTWNTGIGADSTRLRITSSDKLVALCKAALLSANRVQVIQPRPAGGVPVSRQPRIATIPEKGRMPMPQRVLGPKLPAQPQPPANAKTS